jgi:hypothetical protein
MENILKLISSPEFVTVFGIAKDFVTILCVIITAIIASKGLNTWRRQYKATLEYDLAKRTLNDALNLKLAIQNFRSPVCMSGELVEAKKEALLRFNQDIPDDSDSNMIAVSSSRYNRIVELNKILFLDSIEVEVLWGKGKRELVMSLSPIIGELFSSFNLFKLNLDHIHKNKKALFSSETINNIESIIFDQSYPENNDAFAKKIESSFIIIENTLRNYLKKF